MKHVVGTLIFGAMLLSVGGCKFGDDTIQGSVTASLTFSITDANSATSGFAKQTTVTPVITTNNPAYVKWCISETQVTEPSNVGTCNGSSWQVTKPSTFTLSSGDGAKTVYLWVAEASGKILNKVNSAIIILDTILPVVNLTSLTGGSSLGGGSVPAITWTASDLNFSSTPIKLEYSTDGGTTWNLIAANLPNSGSYNWLIPSIESTTCKVRVTATDQSSNLSQSASTSNFSVDSTSPSLSVTAWPLTYSAGASTQSINWVASDSNFGASPIKIEYSGDNGTTWNIVAAAITNGITGGCTLAGADTGCYNWTLPSINSTQVIVRVTATDSVGNIPTVATSSSFTIDSVVPTISSFTLNGGSASSATNFLTTALTATDSLTSVTHMRFSLNAVYANNSWVTYSAASNYVVPFSSASRTVYVWVKDAAGNVSASTNATINVTIGTPPNISLINPDGSILYTAGGQNVHVDWSVTSTVGLAAVNPLTLSYTTDIGVTSTLISSVVTNNSNGGCVVGMGATGCLDFSLPAPLANVPFRLMLKAVDSNGAAATLLGPVVNAMGLTIYAGKNSSLLGNSALSTALNIGGSGGMVMDSQNNLYIVGMCQILRVDSITSVVTRYLGDGVNCTTTGTGSPPSQSVRVNVQGSNYISMDSQDQLYWSDSTTIRRVNKSTGLVEVVVGGGGTASPPTGTNRLAGQFTFISDLTFDSQNRLIFSYHFSSGPNFGVVIYRLNVDDTLEIIAGNYALTNPVSGNDARTGGLGGTTIYRSAGIAIQKGTPDYLFIMADDNWIYKLDLTTSIMTSLYFWNTNHQQMMFDPIRNQLVAAYPGAVKFIDPNSGAVPLSINSVDGFFAIGLARDSAGGIYYTTTLNQRIFYIDTTNAQSTFAGVAPTAGDGGQATLAEIRTPSQMSFDGAGNAYFNDSANAKMRKVDTSGVISSPMGAFTYSGAVLNTGVGTPIFSDYYGNATYRDLTPSANCVWLCGNSAQPWASTTTSSATPANLYVGAATSIKLFVSHFSYDGTNKYMLLLERQYVPSGAYRTSIKKIDNAGFYTEIAGDSSTAPVVSIPAPTVGDTLAGHFAGNAYQFRVVNGNIYVLQANGGVLFSGTEGGTWAKQTTTTMNGFVVSPTNDKIFFINNKKLYRKAYAVGGGGVETLIFDFSSSLSNPTLLAIDPSVASTHAIYISDGNSIYKFVDAVNIP